jgi:hypothetical protein
MPRWARFVSCSFTGLLIAMVGFFFAAWWREGGPGYWQAVIEFVATPAFWYLAGLFGAMAGISLLLARAGANVYGTKGPVPGFLAGAAVALAYSFFLISAHAADWGGFALALQRSWLSVLLLTLPVALAGGFVSWLWDRLD